MPGMKKIISVPPTENRTLEDQPVVAVLELTDEQREMIRAATGRDVPRLELTKVELAMVASPAGYDAPGALN